MKEAENHWEVNENTIYQVENGIPVPSNPFNPTTFVFGELLSLTIILLNDLVLACWLRYYCHFSCEMVTPLSEKLNIVSIKLFCRFLKVFMLQIMKFIVVCGLCKDVLSVT